MSRGNKRKFQRVDVSQEFALAERIMNEIIVPAVEIKPDLNLCQVRNFCEQMHRYVGDYPEEGYCGQAEVCPDVPQTSSNPINC